MWHVHAYVQRTEHKVGRGAEAAHELRLLLGEPQLERCDLARSAPRLLMAAAGGEDGVGG